MSVGGAERLSMSYLVLLMSVTRRAIRDKVSSLLFVDDCDDDDDDDGVEATRRDAFFSVIILRKSASFAKIADFSPARVLKF